MDLEKQNSEDLFDKLGLSVAFGEVEISIFFVMQAN